MLHFLADWYHIILKLEDPLQTIPAISLFTNENATAQGAEVTMTKEANFNPKSLDWIVQSGSLPSPCCLEDSRFKGPKKRVHERRGNEMESRQLKQISHQGLAYPSLYLRKKRPIYFLQLEM